ncbi:MAG: hypothetical protein J6N95_05445 [Bacilli bacterium]|nr:hypothetical protein [Bacilli bacterium]MBO6280626.1 hypothetical protein [Bacilli bacterium]
MKNNRFLTNTLLFVTTTALFLTSCNKQSSSEENKKPSDPNVVDFIDFEEFEPDFQLLRLQNYFGKVSVNENKEFVKSGEMSAKIQPLGSYAFDTKPLLYFELTSEKYEYNYSDLDYLYSMSLWIYNAQNETKTMNVGVVTAFNGLEQGVSIDGGMEYYLNQGWNKITYFIDLEELFIPDGSHIVRGLYLEFDNVKSRNLEDAPVYYLDDVSLKIKPDFKEIIITNNNIGVPNEGETVFVPNASIDGGTVTYTVYHGDMIINAENGHFVADDGGDYKIVYQAIVGDFIYKKTIKFFVKPAHSVDIVNLDDANDINRLKARGVIESIDYVDSFEGEYGAAKVVINRDWPSFTFTPRDNNVNSYEGCDYLVMRTYLKSGVNSLRWFSLNDRAVSVDYEGYYQLDSWIVLKFPIKSFLDNINTSYIVGNSTDYVNFGVFYIAEIFAM